MRQGEIEASQDRSRRTRDRLVVALGTLLREKSFETITIAELAERAGVAVGTVYRRFANKDALIPVIFEVYLKMLEHYADDPANAVTLDETDTLHSALEKICAQGWRMMKAEPHLIRTAHLYARLRPDLVGDDWDAIIETSVAQFAAVLEQFDRDIARRDRNAAARMVFYLLNTVMTEQGLYGDAGPGAALRADEETFVRDCALAIYGYLTAGRSDTPDLQ